MQMEPLQRQNRTGIEFFAAVAATVALLAAGAVALFILGGFSHAEGAEIPNVQNVPFNVWLDNQHQLHVLGSYDYQSLPAIKFNPLVAKVLEVIGNKPVTGVVLEQSQGGDVQFGIWLGIYIYTHDLPVLINGPCISSCAIAATGGLVHNNISISEHGSMWQHMPFAMTSVKEGTITFPTEDGLVSVAGYFARIGINPYLVMQIKYAAESQGFIQGQYLSNGVPNGLFDYVLFLETGGIKLKHSSWSFWENAVWTVPVYAEKDVNSHLIDRNVRK